MILILWWCLFVVASTIAYLVYGITPATALIALIASLLVTLVLHRHKPKEHNSTIRTALFPLIIAVGIDLGILVCFWLVRTDAVLRSPWTAPVTIGTFIAFGLSSIILLYSFRSTSRAFGIIALAIHFFATYGVSLLAFRYGFGYDPIIHQAAERYVVEHGRIFPFQPYYIGQYATVAALSLLTHIRVEYVDRLLVPILSSITIPIAAYHGLIRGYGLSHARALVVSLLTLLYPLSQVTFTVPYNLSAVYAIWWLFFLPSLRRTPFDTIIIFSCVAAALASHPLVGIPILITTSILICVKRAMWTNMLGICAVALSLVAMFACVRLLSGLDPFDFSLMSNGAWRFASLYLPYQIPSFPSLVSTIYWYEYVIKNVVPLATVFILLLTPSIPNMVRTGLLSLSVGSYLGIFFYVNLISLPGIAQNEQYEFILRLKDLIGYILFAVYLIVLMKRIPRLSSPRMVLTASLIGVAASFSLFLTYPQINAARSFAGENISRADLDAIELLEEISVGKNYTVLAPNLLAAAGLRLVGFDRTFITQRGTSAHIYPISSGEPLFPYADAVLNVKVTKELIANLKQLVGDRDTYLLVPPSWWRKMEIANEMLLIGAKKIESNISVTIYRLP